MTGQCAIPGCDRPKLDTDTRCEHHLSDIDLVDPLQIGLFDKDEAAPWYNEWVGMPEFIQDDLQPFKTLIVHFANSADMAEFARMVDQRIGLKTQSIWYPEAEIGRMVDKRYNDASAI
jgi:hypothetical protein